MLNTTHYWKWKWIAQSCPTLCDPMDCSLPGSSVHGIFRAKILEWVAISWEGNATHSWKDAQYHSLLTNTRKDAQYHSLLEKCKSKLQWDITSHWSEWPSSKTSETVSAGEGVEKRECSCTIGGNVNWYSHYGRWYGDSLKKKLGIKLPYNPAIPILGICPKETKIERDICIPLFIPALFTTVRIWKQPKCPATDEWIKKLWYIHKMEYYSAIKRNTFESVLTRWT